MNRLDYDAVVVGGGPGGLSAALWLGRCRRKTLLVDAGEGRNSRARGLHGFLSRDGVPPAELRRLGREEIAGYDVSVREDSVVHATGDPDGFALELASGGSVRSVKLILATGVRDRLPDVAGLEERYGTSVHHCPYCDGWEHRDQALAVYGRGAAGFAVAKKLHNWSADVALCTDGPTGLRAHQVQELARLGIPVHRRRIAQLEGPGTKLESIRFMDGSQLARRALFFTLGWDLKSDLAIELGCRRTRQGCIRTDEHERTSVPGVYAVGDASRDLQLVVLAAAEGAKAAIHLHETLLEERRPGR
ncbi:MAG: NAD(P)/FAD-dependent oxidoreductase [Thermoanaerobaculia bacterium]